GPRGSSPLGPRRPPAPGPSAPCRDGFPLHDALRPVPRAVTRRVVLSCPSVPSRHDAASIAVGRRALGHPIRGNPPPSRNGPPSGPVR
ncbi:hypothetical protein FGD71_029075, partial [Streptomyces sporangiiformans]